jgi:hypothetical protein
MLIAKQSCDRMRNLEILSEVAGKQDIVKVPTRYDTTSTPFAERANAIDEIRRHFGIKSSEEIIASEVCDRVIFDESTGASSYVPGRVLITSNWVLWQATLKKEGEGQWDLSLSILHIDSVEVNGNLIDIDIGQDLLRGEPQQEMPAEISRGKSTGTDFDGAITSPLAAAGCNPCIEGSGLLSPNSNEKGTSRESPAKRNPGLREPASEEYSSEPSRQGQAIGFSQKGEANGQGEADETVVSVQFR